MARTFYHVDRWDAFEPGETIELEPVAPDDGEDGPAWNAAVARSVAERFPGGLSTHGRFYATEDLYEADAARLWDVGCELLFELVRLTDYSFRPSRFQSVFGFRSVADAARFRERYDDPDSHVWAVEAEAAFVADMRLLDVADLGRGLRRARYYWEGGTFIEDPLWEVLLVPPVEVVERVPAR